MLVELAGQQRTVKPYAKPERQIEAPVKSGMRVLIVDFDLYGRVGGGQSAYRKLIGLHPENTYFYFLNNELDDTSRPPNAHGIAVTDQYYANVGDLPAEMGHFYNDYLQCYQLAASVCAQFGNCHFDVVDVPDYVTLGLFLRHALTSHGIGVGVVALALHGTISSALCDQWPRTKVPIRKLAELRMREHLQYRFADVRYALSQTYAAEWEGYTGLPARALDPLLMVGPIMPREAPAGGTPDIFFVGRKERRKGPDLFIDLSWCLKPGSYSQLNLIGDEAPGHSGVSSADILPQMTKRRQLATNSINHSSISQLNEHFAGRSLVVLPSRYDQFNLIALEALRLGCPAFISRHAGAAQWLLQTYPELHHLVIDIDCSRSAAGAIQNTLDNYDRARARLVKALESGPRLEGDKAVARIIYEPNVAHDRTARRAVTEIHQRFDSFNRPRHVSELGLIHRTKQSAKRILPGKSISALIALHNAIHTAKTTISSYCSRPLNRQRLVRRLGHLALATGFLHDDALAPIARAADVEGTRARLLTLPERTSHEVAKKLSELAKELGQMRIARVQIFRDLARLERKQNNDLVSATYCLRIMRWLGHDALGDLEFVVDTLEKHQFQSEANVANAMFADPKLATQRCRDLLAKQSLRHLNKPNQQNEIIDDRRNSKLPKVSVIVSLYNAGDKLGTLLKNLQMQSIAATGRLEVILIDSASPSNEYQIFKDFADSQNLSMVYARSGQRETIQASWNRGIKLARGSYLSFLGVDEGLHPEALTHLSGALDRHSNIDWVMADALVTEVDQNGVHAGDVMTYDRTGYDQNLVYLETCYLSWVAGLYRRSIHDRFGYYDETFRAAGDTEFKARILTHINTMHLPMVLGVFNNYPEERTTQHPRAEIEDLRAWYLHRSPAGIAYSFDAHPVARAEALFRHALSYRKSYCRHVSTDFDLAATIAGYLVQRQESGQFGLQAVASSNALLDHLRKADQLNLQLSPRKRQLQIARMLASARRQEINDRSAFGLDQRPQYRLFNDNRFEQHWWPWSN